VPDIEAKLAEVTAAASWQPSLTSTAMSSDCCRTPETGSVCQNAARVTIR
jgi:hypothetical protein